MNNILVIAAHPDDEIIGLGGTLRKHVKSGDNVSILILGDGKSSRLKTYKPISKIQYEDSLSETKAGLKVLGINNLYKENLADNRFDSLDLLDIVKLVSEYIKKTNPDIIYTHHFGDLNIDHKLSAEAVIISTRPIENKIKELRMFETLSSTEMDGSRAENVFVPNLYINIENELNDKIKALECYKSEIKEFPHPRSIKAIEMNAYLWGAKNNQGATEAFYIFRKYID